MVYSSSNLADLILAKLESKRSDITKLYYKSVDDIGYFFIDDFLPDHIAKDIYDKFPSIGESVRKKSLREHKYVAFQMDRYDPLMESITYAFQDSRILDFFRKTLKINSLYADENLYAGGLSLMKKGNFLNPHLDNSHDKERKRWRVFNLLYYVTPNWSLENGGHLELWSNGLEQEPLTIESKFNRLVVMATHHKSWHSVSKVTYEGVRCCVSNYYFSDYSISEKNQFHVTSFRGRPKDKLTDLILNFDARLRMLLRQIFKKGIFENPHVYKKKKSD